MSDLNSGTEILARRPGHTAGSVTTAFKYERNAVFSGPVMAAIDVSWDSREALIWACRHTAGAAVSVLHVLHDPAEMPGKYKGDSLDPLAPMPDIAEKMLAEFMAEVRENHAGLTPLVEARSKVIVGLPAQTIVDEAVRLNASLIVVGSRGHTGLPRLMYGSTTQRVVQLSPIPVTVVKAKR